MAVMTLSVTHRREHNRSLSQRRLRYPHAAGNGHYRDVGGGVESKLGLNPDSSTTFSVAVRQENAYMGPITGRGTANGRRWLRDASALPPESSGSALWPRPAQ